MKITTIQSVSEAARLVADNLNERLVHGPGLWLLSGGSCVAVAVEAAKLVRADLADRLTVSLIDERFGAVGHSDSNSGIGQLIHHGCPSAEKQHLLFDEICLGDRCRALHRRCRRPPNHPSRSPILLFGNFCLWGLR